MKEPLGRRACSPNPPAGGEGGNHILILGEENFLIMALETLFYENSLHRPLFFFN